MTLVKTQEQSFVDISDWLTQIDDSYSRFRAAGWEFIIKLRDGLDQFGRTNHAKMELYELASQQIGLTVNSLQTYASAARSPVASIAIELGLTFSHARAAIGLETDVAESILTDAAERGWTPEQVSKKAWIHKASQHTLKSNDSTPVATAIVADEPPPYADNSQYKEYYASTEAAFTLPDEYDAGSYIAVPREPVAAARMLRQQFNDDDLDTLVAELIR